MKNCSSDQSQVFEEISLFGSRVIENGISADCSCDDCDGNPCDDMDDMD